jgi:hypothetical protein
MRAVFRARQEGRDLALSVADLAEREARLNALRAEVTQ